MDWSSIGGAALAGALGGLIGGIVGSLVSLIFPKSIRPFVIIVFVVGCVALAPRVIETLSKRPLSDLIDRPLETLFPGPPTAANIERELLAHPEFGDLATAWKQGDPQSFAQAVTHIEAAIASGQDRSEAVSQMRSILISAATPRFLMLDDAHMLEMIAVSRDTYRDLAQAQPGVCRPMFLGQPFGDITPFVSAGVQRRERALLAAAFRADAHAQPAVMRNPELSDAIDRVYYMTQERIGPDVRLLQPGADLSGPFEARYCEVVSAIFETMLVLPPEEAAALMRGIKASA